MKSSLRQVVQPLGAIFVVAGLGLLTAFPAYAQNSKFTSDPSGNLSSQASEIIVLPQILAQPRNQVIVPGDSASFSVLVADSRSVTYQWYFNGGSIAGATADALLLNNVTTNNQGQYYVIVSNPAGPVTSSSASLFIDTDGDGLPDSWEMTYFGNLNQTASSDADGDGVSNLQEYLDGTNPTNAVSVLYRITAVNDGGTVLVSPNQPTYTNGQVVTLSAVGTDVVPFHAWTGDVTTRSNVISLTMTNDKTVFAHFLPFTLTWTNALSGNWSSPSNWTPNLAPSTNESVIMLVPAVVTLNYDVILIDFSLGGLNVGPELTGSGKLTITGSAKWFSGTMSGSGKTVITPGASLSLARLFGYDSLHLTDRTLENGGTLVWGGGNFGVGGSAVITNDAGASFQIFNAANFNYAGGSPRIDNTGLFLPAPGGLTALYNTVFNNSGTVGLTNSGTLLLGGGGSNTGLITVPSGSVLNLGGNFSASSGSTFSGAGTLVVSGGTANLGGTVNVTGTNSFSGGTANLIGNYTCAGNTLLDISGGAVFLNGTGAITPNIVNLNGTLGGANNLVVGTSMTWSGGAMSGSGRTIIPPGATLAISRFFLYGGVSLTDRILENGGTLLWGGGNMNCGGAAVITNDAGASFQILNAPANFNFSGGTPRFDNAGTFLPAPGGITAIYNVAFNNYGVVSLTNAGTLLLGGGGAITGTFTVPAGTTLNFAGGAFNASAGSAITGAGTLLVSTGTANLGGTVNVTGTNSFTGGTANLTGNYTCVGNTLLDISGGAAYFDGTGIVTPSHVNLSGILGGANTVRVGSTMSWSGGTMNGSGRTIINPGATLTIDRFFVYAGVYLTDRILENGGTMVWGGGNFYCGGSAVITNDAGAFFQILNAANFNFSGGTPRFDNSGAFLPAPVGLIAIYNVAFNNYGAVSLTNAGTLSLGGGGSITGTFTVPAGTTLNFAGGAFNASPGSAITGAGTLLVSGGTANLGGTVNVTGTHSFTGGSANLTGNYTCVSNTLLDISGGAVYFDGTGNVAPNNVNLNGILGGANTVRVGNTMSWSGGTMNGTGKTVIQPGASLNIAFFSGYGGVYLSGRTLENAGSVLWGGGNFNMTSCVVTNDAGATFQIQNPASFNYGGGNNRFDNAGTFLPSRTGTTAFNNIILNNYAVVNLRGGVLAANGGYFSSSNSVLSFALWGTTPGITYGQLQVPTSATLNGGLSLSLTNHFIPATNDAFTLVTTGTKSGAFATFDYPSNGLSMVLSNTPASQIARVTGVSLVSTNPLATPPGIISWWRAENDSLDAVGTNHGTLTNGVTFAAGQVGQSFLLNGTNNYVVVADSPSLRPVSVTVEAWVRIFSTNGIELIFAKPLGSGTLDSYGLALQNGVPLAAICDNAGFGTFLNGTAPLALGQWYHLAFTFDNATGQEVLYVNGAPVASANAGRSMSYDSHPLLLGADIENGVPGYSLNGQIDEAAIYSRALDADEIASIYNVASAGKQSVSTSLPVLHLESISAAAGRLYWSTNFPSYHLEYNPVLGGANWAASGLRSAVVGTNFVVTNSLSGTQRFYRLSQVAAPYTPTPPTLKIQLVSPGTVRLLWPVDDDRTFLLQSSTNASMTNWSLVSTPPVVAGTNNIVTNAISGSAKFYRLSTP